MNIIQEVQKLSIKKKKLPELRAGLTVNVHQKIQEGAKSRIQMYKGIIIAVSSGFGPDKTITVRKVVGGIGVEKIFPIHSTNVEKIEVIKAGKVRRSKLYYLRNRFGKSARMKEELISSGVIVEEETAQKAEETLPAAPEVETNPPVEPTPQVELTPAVEPTPEEKPVEKEALEGETKPQA